MTRPPSRTAVPDVKTYQGMVTVELAMGLAAVVMVLAIVLGAVATVRLQAQVCQAVREGARAAAMGESATNAAATAFSGSLTVSSQDEGQWVQVSGSAPAVDVGGLSLGSVTCSVRTLREVGG